MLSQKSPIPSPPLPYPPTHTFWPIGLANFICLSTGERHGQEVGVGVYGSVGEGLGEFWDSIGNVNKENT